MPCNSMPRLKNQRRSRLDQSEMFGWRRAFDDLGWAVAMADPMCYSYYLASRIESTIRDGAPDFVPPRVVYENRPRRTGLINTGLGH